MSGLKIGVTLPVHGHQPVTHPDAARRAEEPGCDSGWMHEGLRLAEDALVDLLSRSRFRSGSGSDLHDS